MTRWILLEFPENSCLSITMSVSSLMSAAAGAFKTVSKRLESESTRIGKSILSGDSTQRFLE